MGSKRFDGIRQRVIKTQNVLTESVNALSKRPAVIVVKILVPVPSRGLSLIHI